MLLSKTQFKSLVQGFQFTLFSLLSRVINQNSISSLPGYKILSYKQLRDGKKSFFKSELSFSNLFLNVIKIVCVGDEMEEPHSSVNYLVFD